MTRAPLDTLFYPFTNGDLSYPLGRALFVNAQHHPALASFPAIDCCQDFYPDAAGLPFLCEQPKSPYYDCALVLIPKDKTAAQYDLARALDNTVDGGLIVACAANDAGGGRLKSWFEEAGLHPESLSKNKCRVVWARKTSSPPAAWLADGVMHQIAFDGDLLWTQAGLFGWDKIDVGSKLLVSVLPSTLKGAGADFGCGYGYLSHYILKNHIAPTITAIDADRRAVACCAKNCLGIETQWADLTAYAPPAPFDWIVMNPPFHDGKTTAAHIGLAFIETAAASLKKGGLLYMVANRQLPYEPALARLFSQTDIVKQENGFKIMIARK